MKLADVDILDPSVKPVDESRNRHQIAKMDEISKNSTRYPKTSLYQRSGVMTPFLDINIMKFSSQPEDDVENTVPPPPETMQLNSRVFGLPLRLDILQTVYIYAKYFLKQENIN